MGTGDISVQARQTKGQTRSIIQLFVALLGLSLFLGACYWQPDGRETNLAIEATVPNLLASGGIGAQQTFTGDGTLYVYVIEESYLLLSPEELNNLFDALENAQDLSQEELDARYPAARIRTLPISFGLGTAGSVGLTGLKGDATYVVAVFAEACEGTLLDEYDCNGTWHEAMDFRRRTLPAGETTQVSLNLDDNFQAFDDFLLAEYGFESGADDEGENGDEVPGDGEETTELAEIGTHRMYNPPTAYLVSVVNNANTYNIPFDAFVWEYRGVGFDGTQDVAVFHLWWYDTPSWAYNDLQPYDCPDMVTCAPGAGRLDQLVANQGGYIHARVLVPDPTVSELPGLGFLGNEIEFMKLTISAAFPGVSELPSDIDVALPSIMTGVDAGGAIVQAVAEGLFPDVTESAPNIGNSVTVDLGSLIEVE